MQTVTFLIEKTNGGYTAYAEGFSILTDGKTIKQVRANALEAVKEQCEVTGENSADFDVTFEYDVASAFDALNVNTVALTQRSGLNGTLISQYVSGKKRPSEKQRKRIESALHEYGREILGVRLS